MAQGGSFLRQCSQPVTAKPIDDYSTINRRHDDRIPA
jgi:hypothetical protein